jgi:hypothetical protein
MAWQIHLKLVREINVNLSTSLQLGNFHTETENNALKLYISKCMCSLIIITYSPKNLSVRSEL